ncbi:AzlC family ABC transporter permease [Pontitalea aquivivens]|uniref:AzlC family ABC transporter permease n=1 Tax=Pontitalea aquivivens TaxID=3388663 RepID=UPI003970BBF3
MQTPSANRSAFWRGFRQGLPFLLVIIPFGLLFGVAATEAGLPITAVMGFSVLVLAGASQFTAVQLIGENAPTVLVVVTALAVNLRMAMYSASLAPHLGPAPVWKRALVAYCMIDQSYTLAAQDYDRAPDQTVAEKLAYYAGACSHVCPAWVVATWAGAAVGQAIPPEFALDFAIPITFLAMLAPAMRTLAHVAAATVSVALALVLAFLPSGLGLLVAAVAAMTTGAQVELWAARRRAAGDA